MNKRTENKVEFIKRSNPNGKDIYFYVQKNGKKPAEKWILKYLGLKSLEDFDGLSGKNKRKREILKLFWLLNNIANGKNIEGSENIRHLDNIGHELKSYQCRLVGVFDGQAFVLLFGFVKKADKTPKKELGKGIRLRKEFDLRKK